MISSVDSDCSVGLEFYEFLEESEKCSIRVDGWNSSDDAWCTSQISGLHRWKPEYGKRTYAKVQCLNDWYVDNHLPYVMGTFTTRQDGITIPEQLELLVTSFGKAMDALRRKIGKFSYVWTLEAHDSGYSHIHLIIFGEVPKKVRRELKELWGTGDPEGKYGKYGKYGAGGFRDALQFEKRKTDRTLKSAAAYIFAYVSKALHSESLSDVNSGYYRQSSWVWKMSQRDSPYNGVRMWGCSQDISEAMAYSGEKNPDVIWWRVSWKTDDGWYPLWIDEDMAAYPERIYEFDSLLALGNVNGCSSDFEAG